MPFSEIQQVVHVVVVDDHGAFGAEQLDAVGLAERRIVRRQRVAHAEIDHRAVGERDDRPGHVVGAVAGLLEDAVLAARHHLDRPVAFQEPAHQVDVIGQHVQHRRRVRIALEDGEGLGARVVDARGAADDLAEPAVEHLLLGAQEAFLVAAAVADAQVALGLPQRLQDPVGVGRARSRSASRPAPACRARAPAGSARCARCSGVDTITAVTSGWLMTSSLLPVWKSAPACSASALRAPGSRSEIARKRTDGCLAASRARNVPMRPAPMTAMPMLDCLFIATDSSPRPVWR